MAAKRVGKGNQEKTASMTVRLDPKLKYGLEILARKQYRNLSSLVEWSLNKALSDPEDGLPDLDKIWDVYEADRLVKLALYKPELLNFDEQKIWKLIKENGACWKGGYVATVWTWSLCEQNVYWSTIREHWEVFKKVAAGDGNEDMLPKLPEKDPADGVSF